MVTNEQKMAHKAFSRISARKLSSSKKDFKEYRSLAMSFPSLIHTCGLVQAMSYAQAKKREDYVEDINAVFAETDDAGRLEETSRSAELSDYLRMTLHALSAAGWLKRYCQAVSGGENSDEPQRCTE